MKHAHFYRLLSGLVLFVFAFLIHSSSPIVQADTVAVDTQMTLKKADQTPVVAGDVLNEVNPLTLSVDFSLPNNQAKAGDTSVITLPSVLRLENGATFDVTDEDGNVVATAVADKSNNTVTLTYTDYVENHSDISFHLDITLKVNSSKVQSGSTYPVEFNVNGDTVYSTTFTYKPKTYNDNPKEVFTKYAWLSGDGKTLHYTIRVNVAKNTYSNVVVSDILQSGGITYNTSSFKIQTGDFYIDTNGSLQLSNGTDVTSQYVINTSDDKSSFTIDMGDISTSFLITYTVDINYTPKNNEELINYAALTADQKQIGEDRNVFTFQSMDGTANGYNYTLALQKNDENGQALAGATFNLVRKATGQVVATLTTDADGKATVTGLLRDDYLLTETAAPDGYLKAEDVTVSEDDFDKDTLTANVTVVDKTIPTTTISGTKTWDDGDDLDGIRPSQITVNLLANNVMISSQVVTAATDWTYSFADLPETDADGNSITYTISEDDVDGYVATIDGYNITNAHTPTTPPSTSTDTSSSSSTEPSTSTSSSTVPSTSTDTSSSSSTVPSTSTSSSSSSSAVPSTSTDTSSSATTPSTDTSRKVLPSTGEAISVGLVAAGIAVAGLAIFLISRNKKDEN